MKEIRLIGDEFLWVTGWQGVCRRLGQAKKGWWAEENNMSGKWWCCVSATSEKVLWW